jgi:hypothetical protein
LPRDWWAQPLPRSMAVLAPTPALAMSTSSLTFLFCRPKKQRYGLGGWHVGSDDMSPIDSSFFKKPQLFNQIVFGFLTTTTFLMLQINLF